jgi:hypothetical protein
MSEAAEAREYQDRARECVQIAGTIADPGYKLFILDVAQAWVKLAKADRNDVTDAVQAKAAALAGAIPPDLVPARRGAVPQQDGGSES